MNKKPVGLLPNSCIIFTIYPILCNFTFTLYSLTEIAANNIVIKSLLYRRYRPSSASHDRNCRQWLVFVVRPSGRSSFLGSLYVCFISLYRLAKTNSRGLRPFLEKKWNAIKIWYMQAAQGGIFYVTCRPWGLSFILHCQECSAFTQYCWLVLSNCVQEVDRKTETQLQKRQEWCVDAYPLSTTQLCWPIVSSFVY